MKLTQVKIVNFRNISNMKFNIGNKITVISGQNGIGKSSILSLIASTSGTKQRRLDERPFQPEFTDYFKVSDHEKYSNYRILVGFEDDGYQFAKRIGFKNDIKSGRSIRALPRGTTPIENPLDLTVAESIKQVRDKFSIGDSQRVPIPTIYSSLSRLFPLGETDLISQDISAHTKIFQQGYYETYRTYFNSVLPNSIDESENNMTFLRKKATGKDRVNMPILDSSEGTQSVGQDNLGYLVSALLDFYALKKSSKHYTGGILCIDELDSSLHPSAVIKLFSLLKHLCTELNLQIIITSHSLTILQQIIKLQNRDPQNYQLVYLKDPHYPLVEPYSNYEMLKADLFDQVSFKRPPITMYGEDKLTTQLFKILIETILKLKGTQKFDQTILNSLKISTISEFKIVDVELGKDQLKKLPQQDPHFEEVLILLDGDARSKKPLNNDNALHSRDFAKGLTTTNPKSNSIVYLPTFTPPEIYLFNIVKEYVNSPTNHSDFWISVTANSDTTLYSSAKLMSSWNTKSTQMSFDKLHSKQIVNDILNFVSKTDLLVDYYSQVTHKSELIEFVKHLINALDNISAKSISTFF